MTPDAQHRTPVTQPATVTPETFTPAGEWLAPTQLLGGALILLSAALAVGRLRRVPWRTTAELP